MGVYIFKKEALYRYLIEDEANELSSNDFGKNVIPAMLFSGEKLFAYPFEGYWKDVGTLQSLWEGNMDLLGSSPKLDLNDYKWKISYRHYPEHPHFIGETGSVKNSVVAEGCEIHGTVMNSVLFSGVTVEKGAMIKDCVVMRNTHVMEGASIQYSILDVDVTIGRNAVVGESRENNKELTVLGRGVKIIEGGVIYGGEMMDSKLYLEKSLEKLYLQSVSKVIRTDDMIHTKMIEREAIE